MDASIIGGIVQLAGSLIDTGVNAATEQRQEMAQNTANMENMAMNDKEFGQKQEEIDMSKQNSAFQMRQKSIDQLNSIVGQQPSLQKSIIDTWAGKA
jgi:hypothetical protein